MILRRLAAMALAAMLVASGCGGTSPAPSAASAPASQAPGSPPAGAFVDPAPAPYPDSLADGITPAYSAATGFTADAVKILSVMSMRIALERYRAAKGAYPPSLDALFPAYAPAGSDGAPMAGPPPDVSYAQSGQGYTLAAVLASGGRYGVDQSGGAVASVPDARVAAARVPAVPSSVSPAALPPAVSADNSWGNVIASGAVERDIPADALVTVTNGYRFWTAVDLEPPSGGARLTSAMMVGNPPMPTGDARGLWAAGGVLPPAPGGTTAYRGVFDPATGGSQYVRVHIDLASAGGAVALGANVLQVFADAMSVRLAPSDPGKLLSAIKLVTDLPDFAGVLAAVQKGDAWAFATSFYKLLGSQATTAAIVLAFAAMGVGASAAAVAAAVTLLLALNGIINYGRLIVDLMAAAVGGHATGKVAFTLAATPSATPTARPTAVPTPTPIPVPVTAKGKTKDNGRGGLAGLGDASVVLKFSLTGGSVSGSTVLVWYGFGGHKFTSRSSLKGSYDVTSKTMSGVGEFWEEECTSSKSCSSSTKVQIQWSATASANRKTLAGSIGDGAGMYEFTATIKPD